MKLCHELLPIILVLSVMSIWLFIYLDKCLCCSILDAKLYGNRRYSVISGYLLKHVGMLLRCNKMLDNMCYMIFLIHPQYYRMFYAPMGHEVEKYCQSHIYLY